MTESKEYRFNSDTLEYDAVKEESKVSRSLKSAVLYSVSVFLLFIAMVALDQRGFEIKTPNRLIVEKNSKEWSSKLDILNRKLERVDSKLKEMSTRDNNIYRSIFGMEILSEDVRNAGYGGVDRYSYLSDLDHSGVVASSVIMSDVLTKKAYIQSKSFDQISYFSARSEEMTLCVPNIPPVNFENVRYTSGFGMRLDPVSRRAVRRHQGVDLAPKSGKDGEPIYATGDGVVTDVSFQLGGFGHYVVIDHGFGYITRYAHLRKANVAVGQRVKRGEQIAEMGNTGHSTATHLHYEIIYMGRAVNPVNYYDMEISAEDYASIIGSPEIPLS